MREAILRLNDTQLEKAGLDDIVDATRDAGLHDITELVCHGPGGIILLDVAEPIPETELNTFESVEWWERLGVTSSCVTYLCKVSAPDLPEEFSLDEHCLAHDVAEVHEDGIDLSIIGSQEDINRSVAAVDDAGMNALLERLTDYRGTPSTLEALTDRQREVVQTAYAIGYYDVPRRGSSTDIADALNVDPSTVSEHLQRAERNLLTQILG